MTNYRGRGQGSKTSHQIWEVECPACGCPNKPGDKRCMYCRGDLPYHGGRPLKVVLSPYLSNLRQFFNPVPASKRGWPMWKFTLSVLLSTALLGVGLTFIHKGYQSGGYFNWVVATLLVFYGVAAIRNAVISYRK